MAAVTYWERWGARSTIVIFSKKRLGYELIYNHWRFCVKRKRWDIRGREVVRRWARARWVVESVPVIQLRPSLYGLVRVFMRRSGAFRRIIIVNGARIREGRTSKELRKCSWGQLVHAARRHSGQ